MNNEITLDDIKIYENIYQENTNNIEIQKRIKKLGIMKASVDEKIKDSYNFQFNIEIPEDKISNQHNSYQCNIFAFLKVVNSILIKNGVDTNNLNLSATYISFFDKLEKVNSLYNDLISCKHITLETINAKVNRYIGIYGTFHFCRSIINKYGLVPTTTMNEVDENYNENMVVELLRDKIKTDAITLMNIKRKSQRKEKKKELIKEAYIFLSKVMGAPPQSFIFKGEELTPLEFKNKYLGTNLEEYVTVTTFNKKDFFNTFTYIPNVYLNEDEEIISLSKEKLKSAIISQLKDGIGVWFSSEESTTLDYDYDILDDKLYNYHDLLNIKATSKKQKMLLELISYDHAMCITGALVEDNELKQLKVDNSFGKHGTFKGRLIMTPSFLGNCLITAIINKKYIK